MIKHYRSEPSRPSLVLRLSSVLATVVTTSCCSPALAKDVHLTKTIEAAKAIVVSEHARSRDNCEGIEPPALYLDKPPDHGTVCFRPGNTTPAEIMTGNATQCLGRKIAGVRVIYLSRWRYTGRDELRYTVVFPEARLTIYLELHIVSNLPGSPGTVPPDISAPSGEASQSPGPMPECSALAS
jgi:hypothetical protein